MSDMLKKQFQFTRLFGLLLEWIHQQGYQCRLGDAWRSTDKLYVPSGEDGFEDDLRYSYQELLFYNKKSKVVHSKHNDRLAVDLIIHKGDVELKPEEYRPIGEKWESMGGRWGGRFGVKKEDYSTRVRW